MLPQPSTAQQVSRLYTTTPCARAQQALCNQNVHGAVSRVSGLGILCSVVMMMMIGGCAQQSFTMTMGMTADQQACVEVLGEHPFIMITNNGPGELDVRMESSSRGTVAERTMGAIAFGRSVRDGGIVHLRSGSASTRVRIEARSADGIRLLQRPIAAHPATPPAADPPPAATEPAASEPAVDDDADDAPSILVPPDDPPSAEPGDDLLDLLDQPPPTTQPDDPEPTEPQNSNEHAVSSATHATGHAKATSEMPKHAWQHLAWQQGSTLQK